QVMRVGPLAAVRGGLDERRLVLVDAEAVRVVRDERHSVRAGRRRRALDLDLAVRVLLVGVLVDRRARIRPRRRRARRARRHLAPRRGRAGNASKDREEDCRPHLGVLTSIAGAGPTPTCAYQAALAAPRVNAMTLGRVISAWIPCSSLAPSSP